MSIIGGFLSKMEEYKTVKQKFRSETMIERSRFIATVCRVDSALQANAFLEGVKKEFSDATHTPYAYIVERGGYSRFSDDGEPSGTSGAPILEAIKAAGLVDVCVAVTRYFGGVKLGTGGLVRAYGGAASDVLKAAGSIKRCLCSVCSVRLPYDKQNLFPKLSAEKGKIIKTEYLDDVVIEFAVKSSCYGEFCLSFKDALKGKYDIQEIKREYFDLN